MYVAAPVAIGSDFSNAPPGHRFGLYYAGWDKNWKLGANDKSKSLEAVIDVDEPTRMLVSSLRQRQQALATAAGDDGLSLPAISTAPFLTGLGAEHPLENGFAFLNPYGVPYLPGSGIKGVLLRAAKALQSGQFPGGEHGWTLEAIDALFGTASSRGQRADEDENAGSAGVLSFWDAIPMLQARLTIEIMTPHYAEYYQGTATPHDSGKPNPLPLLALPPKTQFMIHVLCDSKRLAPGLAACWRELMTSAFDFAFDWLGFGAKTSVGYGQMHVDQKERDRLAGEAQERMRQAREKAQRAERLQGLSPIAARLTTEAEDGNWDDDKNRFAANGVIEGWLDQLESDPQSDAIERLVELIDKHFPKLLENPDAVQGKKQKQVFNDRQRKMAQRLLALRR